MIRTPYPYQIKQIDDLADEFASGKKRVVAQLPTGGGKTIEFATLCNRFLIRNPTQNILILVHREELLNQAYNALYEWYGIIAELVTASNRHPRQARVYIAMVETANNRLKKSPTYFNSIGLLLIDECHLGNFTKLLNHFPDTITVGFTATPIAASKKHPLKEIYESIVVGPQIEELIEMERLVQNITYAPENVHAEELVVSRTGDFDSAQMGAVYSKPKHIKNAVTAYEKYCLGTKTIVFNCNVEHSKLVTAAFVEAGYNARHLDADSTDREETLKWFAETGDAVLCNIGILTTGFDEPTILSVLVNKDTLSSPLWLQMTGRGGRTYPGKEMFVIVDMGTNARRHFDWSATRDWADLFYYPDKPRPKEGGIGSVTECKSCEALIAATAKICRYCGAEQPERLQTYDGLLSDFVVITKNIDVVRLVKMNENRKPYYTLAQISKEMVWKAKAELNVVDDAAAYKLLETYQEKVAEWCKISKKNYNQWHKEMTAKWFFEDMEKSFGWKPQEISIAI